MSRHGYRHGVKSRPWLLSALGLASFLLTFAGLWLAGLLHVPVNLGWALLVAAGYLAWSRFARRRSRWKAAHDASGPAP